MIGRGGNRPRSLDLALMVILAAAVVSSSASAQTTPTNNAPVFTDGASTTRSVDENMDAGTDVGAAVSATDEDGDSLTYSLGGTDAASFRIVSDTGQLQTAEMFNYEVKSVYAVTVTVSDQRDDAALEAEIDVTVNVGNVDEPGTATISPPQARIRQVLRARVDDPDGPVRAKWQWSRSSDQQNWTTISGADDWHYTPGAADRRMYLRAVATYSQQDVNKTLTAYTSSMVAAPEWRVQLAVSEVATGLDIPWDLAFAPDGTILFTERKGTIGAIGGDGTIQSVSADISDLAVTAEAGLMAILLDSSFASNRRFYTCQSHVAGLGDYEVQVISWTIKADYTVATRVDDPLVGITSYGHSHEGCRLRYGPDGYLWIATGDGKQPKQPGVSQDLTSLSGKILRVDAATGAGAPGNPFSAPNSTLIYTYGHRNPQGLALRPDTTQMWAVEHGPVHDDEINLLTSGGNYGWLPVNHDGSLTYHESVKMTDLGRFPGAIEAKWSSGQDAIATSGGIFLEGDWWGDWEGLLAVASLKDETLRVFDFTDEGALEREILVRELNETYGRLRTPLIGPDEALYLTTSNTTIALPDNDKILRVSPQVAPEFPDGTETTVSIAENSDVSNVIISLSADERNRESVTYSLSGDDMSHFNLRDSTVGDIRANSPLDYEAESSYSVTMTASDPGGLSDSIDLTINVVDDDTEAPSVPSAPIVGAASTSSVAVSWDAPANAGPAISDYNVQYRVRGTSGWYDWAHSGSGTGTTIDGLEASTTYEVQVQATNAEGTSGWSSSGTGTTEEAPNTAPVFGSASYSRSVAENTAPGTDIGTAISATDADGDTLTYSLGGTDAGHFTIDDASGQLATSGALNYESEQRYGVTVSVSDGRGGNASASVAITVSDERESPGAPAAPAVSATAGSTTSVDVNWAAPANTGPAISDYDVQYRAASSAAWRAWSHQGTERSTVISGLSAGAAYQVQVRASNAEGVGAWSTSGSGTTSTPTNTAPVFGSVIFSRSVAENTASGVGVGSPVSASDADGDTLSYSLGGTDAGRFTIVAGSGQIRTSGDLDHETTDSYSVRVTAADGEGGSASASVAITVTDVEEPPQPPAAPAVSATAGSTTSLDANWAAPANTGPAISDYDVQYRAVSSAAWRAWSYQGTERSTVISGLSAGAAYQVQVRASNAEGVGAWSTSGSGTTSTPTNTAPVFGSASYSRSVAENTAAGVNIGSPVSASDADGDTLSYSLGGTDAGRFTIVAGSGQIRTSGDLDHETTDSYSVRVTAADGEGGSASASVAITVNDVEEPPQPPAAPAVSATAGSTTSVDVNWAAPANTGPAISDYDVQYRAVSSAAWRAWSHQGTERSTVITGLSAGTAYQVQVRATNAEGTSGWSSSGTGTTSDDPPSDSGGGGSSGGGGAGGGGGSGGGGAGGGGSVPAPTEADASVEDDAHGPSAAGFADVNPGSVHAASIDALFAAGVTAGCRSQPLSYCPHQPVTRAEMATFLARALDLATATAAGFGDVNPGSVHAASIDALFAAGVTTGCRSQPLSYCPHQPVTRAEMATFLARALNLPTPSLDSGG